MKLSDSIHSNNSEIKNIILDWGGVITDLDFKRCASAFIKLGMNNFDEKIELLRQNNLFKKFETGLIPVDAFKEEFYKTTGLKISSREFKNAWMMMICDLQEERWNLLHKIKNNYRTFLLSNTNVLHVEGYTDYLKNSFGADGFSGVFEKIYYSHEMGMRKPDPEIFTYVLSDSKLNPHETLFIDDTLENIETAKRLGINTIHLQPPLTLLDLFDYGKD